MTRIIITSIQVNISITSKDVTSNISTKFMEKWLGIISMTNRDSKIEKFCNIPHFVL